MNKLGQAVLGSGDRIKQRCRGMEQYHISGNRIYVIVIGIEVIDGDVARNEAQESVKTKLSRALLRR